ncbi:signal peptidase II [Amorphus orientalis]|uniref:Lipoprotein signal peptidase n=1 Tax=Amorphus orientalis TaxID=649198 RepID=A0AAE3VQU9_9HYPH|nr:signal peptidase II [Amorphus orientalis]MDQ0316165.1 signal peptidase II [Amorphus orientalis]
MSGEPVSQRPLWRYGFLVAAIVLVVDQAVKLWLLRVVDIAATGPIRVTSFMDLVLVWNQGISYGMFQQETELGRWLLVVFTLIIVAFLCYWLATARDRWIATSLALIVGGAVGNIIDRIAYGAVADFVHLYAGSFSWYVFNVADATIAFGVIGLLIDAVLRRRNNAAMNTSGGSQR